MFYPEVGERRRCERWRRIWRTKLQHRVRICVWIMSHGRILTNEERRRRHLTTSALCVRCQLEEEEVLHSIRNCSRVIEVWSLIIPQDVAMEFYTPGLKDWVFWLLQMGRQGGREGR